jgi:hypothetical protein
VDDLRIALVVGDGRLDQVDLGRRVGVLQAVEGGRPQALGGLLGFLDEDSRICAGEHIGVHGAGLWAKGQNACRLGKQQAEDEEHDQGAGHRPVPP